MFVYLVTNSANGKRYVGITTASLEQRWYQHRWLAAKGATQALYKAIRKYGAEQFQIEPIDTANTLEELLVKERAHIERLGTFTKNGRGYNMTLGGDGVFGFEFDEETRNRMAAAALARFADPVERQRQSERQQKYWTATARALMSEKIAKVHASNPDQARLHSEFMKKHVEPEEMRRRSRLLWDAPGARVRHRSRQQAYWSDENNRKKRSHEIRARFAENPNYAKNIRLAKRRLYKERPEVAARHSQYMKERYANDPAVAEQYRQNALKAYEADPTLRIRQGQSRRNFYANNPDARQKAADVAKQKAAQRSALRERLLLLAAAFEKATGEKYPVPSRSEGGWQLERMEMLIGELESEIAKHDRQPSD
jgi:group I intron endonuclease